MKKKLTIEGVKKRVCYTFYDVDNASCDNCPYCDGNHCTLEADLKKLFAPTPIPTAEEWVSQMNANFVGHKGLLRGALNPYTVLVDTNTETMALAKCSADDDYDVRIGIAIAYARFCGLPVHPKYAAKKDKVLGRDE